MFTIKLDNILTAGVGTTSYDIEQYDVFVSLLFSVAYPSVVSYMYKVDCMHLTHRV